jgi:iron complex outermembrane recepter protein
LVADLRGLMFGLDYVGGLFYTVNTASDGAVDGYVNAPFVRAHVAAGNLNPFAPATAAQLAIIEQAKRKGTFATAEGRTHGVDFRVSGDLFSLGGGAAAFSLGGEARKENYRNDTDDAVVLAIPSAGRSPNHVSGARDVYAISGELLLPVTKALEFQLAARADRYSDAGGTFNPKLAFRFQPIQSLVFRGSVNTGFKAPALDDLYGPQTITFAAGAVNDPLLCPGGKVDTAAGGLASRDCGSQVQVQQGGNPDLKPEKSKTFTIGVAVEPMSNMTFSIDYYDIRLTEQISAIDQISILGNAALYGNKIIRCKAISVTQQAELNRCQADNLNSNAIGYVVTLTDNIGKVNTSGIDLGFGYQVDGGGAGKFNLEYNGTWVKSYKYQNSPSDPLKENVGIYVDGSPVFRWQHTLGFGWRLGDFSSRLSLRNKSGYVDQNSATTVVGGESFYQNVKPYTLVDLSLTAKILKNFTLTGGVTNLFNTDPPFSNQSTRSQRGYDPRYTDPTGRAFFVRTSLNF